METTFGAGGALCVALGVALGAVYLLAGVPWTESGAIAAPALFVVMGAIFLWVARDARRYRLELLALGQPTAGDVAGGERHL